MSTRAIAFHEGVATEEIDGHESDPLTRTRPGKCVKCNLAFAIVLAVKTDPRNPEYVGHLNAIIADDCINGLHRDRYVLEELD
jgi:hypothetical protein